MNFNGHVATLLQCRQPRRLHKSPVGFAAGAVMHAAGDAAPTVAIANGVTHPSERKLLAAYRKARSRLAYALQNGSQDAALDRCHSERLPFAPYPWRKNV
jgi:hypothetical protein